MKTQPQQASIATIALASTIGCTIEWYDFFVYGVVTPLVFNQLFFPNFDPVVGTLLAWTTFLSGFLLRPLGGIVFGHYGDRYGRKIVLIVTLLIMGVATFAIGLLPTYQHVGIWSPILLLGLRLLQGFALGGEWGGAVLMSVEHSPKNKRGYYGSWTQIAVPIGLILASATVSILNLFGEYAFLAWGWRAAFLISGLLVPIGLFIRVKVLETPAFVRAKEAKSIAKAPFLAMWRTHSYFVLLGMGSRYIEGLCFNTFGVFLVGYIVNNLKLPRYIALLAIVIPSLMMIVTLPLFARLSDHVGRRKVVGWGAIATGLSIFPAFWALNENGGSLTIIWAAVAIPFGILYAAVHGPQATVFSELFPTRFRYTAVSFVYQAGGIFSSGLTPLIATSLIVAGDGAPWLFCTYFVVVSIISALSVYLMPETSQAEIDYEEPAALRQDPDFRRSEGFQTEPEVSPSIIRY